MDPSCGPQLKDFCNNNSIGVRNIDPCPDLGVQGSHYYLRSHFLITIATLGVLFNLLSLPILYHVYFKKKQNTLWILFTTLALSDIVEIVIYFSTYSLLYYHPDSDYILEFFVPNQKWILMVTSSTMTVNRWMVVLISLSRVYIIKRAKKGLTFNDSRSKLAKVGLIICGLVFISFIANIFRLNDYEIVSCQKPGMPGLKLQTSAAACKPAFLWGYSTLFMIGLNNIVPVVVLIISNAYIVIKLLWGQNSSVDGGGQAAKIKINASKMCVAVAVVYLLCQTPYFIETIQNGFDQKSVCDHTLCLDKMCDSKMQSCPFKNLKEILPTHSISEIKDAVLKCDKNVTRYRSCICNELFREDSESLAESLGFWKYLGMMMNCSVNFFIYAVFSNSFREVIMETFWKTFQQFQRCIGYRPVDLPSHSAPRTRRNAPQRNGSGVNAGPGMTVVSLDSANFNSLKSRVDLAVKSDNPEDQ